MIPSSWRCPVCQGKSAALRWPVPADTGGECGVAAGAFRPSSDSYGRSSASVVRCDRCGHGSLATLPEKAGVDSAYEEAADPVSLREEAGQIETAHRALRRLEQVVSPGTVADIGCWTGSFLAAARSRGWETYGVDPSRWAVGRAQGKGLNVWQGGLDDPALGSRTYRVVAMCDVMEHLASPADAVTTLTKLVEPGGALYITVPDAGSALARILGRKWWSVLPMHLQYFTRDSLRMLLESGGFTVRSMRSHTKVFTARYYGERLGGYNPLLEQAVVGLLTAARQDTHLVSPNFFDRVQVIATR